MVICKSFYVSHSSIKHYIVLSKCIPNMFCNTWLKLCDLWRFWFDLRFIDLQSVFIIIFFLKIFLQLSYWHECRNYVYGAQRCWCQVSKLKIWHRTLWRPEETTASRNNFWPSGMFEITEMWVPHSLNKPSIERHLVSLFADVDIKNDHV